MRSPIRHRVRKVCIVYACSSRCVEIRWLCFPVFFWLNSMTCLYAPRVILEYVGFNPKRLRIPTQTGCAVPHARQMRDFVGRRTLSVVWASEFRQFWLPWPEPKIQSGITGHNNTFYYNLLSNVQFACRQKADIKRWEFLRLPRGSEFWKKYSNPYSSLLHSR